MNRLLIIAASSDLSISYLESIKNDKLDIDVIVRNSSRIPENILSMIDEIYEFDWLLLLQKFTGEIIVEVPHITFIVGWTKRCCAEIQRL